MKTNRPRIGWILFFVSLLWGSVFLIFGNGAAQVLFDSSQVYLPLVMKPAQPTPTFTPTVRPTPIPHEGTLIIDHRSVALFNQIPDQYENAAENLRITYMDRSVGQNISDGLTCLASPNWESSPSHCRRDYIDSSLTEWKTFTTSDSNIPEAILFPGGNDRSNINVVFAMGTWEEDLKAFISAFPSYASNNDIITFQHNYLHVAAGSTIDNVYFDPSYSGTNIYDLMALETQYPNKTFIYWTSSLALTIGTADAQSFNDQLRDWAAENGKILFDVADIESHNPDGSACRNAQGYEILCQRYTTETDGGHLGSVSAGKLQIAKAMWVMLAQIEGWNP